MVKKNLKEGARYEFAYCVYSEYSLDVLGHVCIIEKDKNGNLEIYDPQVNKRMSEKEVITLLKMIYYGQYDGNRLEFKPKVLRIDDKQFNPYYVDSVTLKHKTK